MCEHVCPVRINLRPDKAQNVKQNKKTSDA